MLNSVLSALWALLRARGLPLAGVFGGVLLPLIAFGGLAHALRAGSEFSWDESAMLCLRQFAGPQMDAFVAFMTLLARVTAVPGLCLATVLVGFLLRHRWAAVFFGVGTAGAWLLNISAKLVFGRDRPALWPSIVPEYDHSFPSGHAMLSASLALTVVLLTWNSKWRWPAVAVAWVALIGIGWSRLYLGVHYPSDILGGWLAGWAWIGGLYALMKPLLRPNTGPEALPA